MLKSILEKAIGEDIKLELEPSDIHESGKIVGHNLAKAEMRAKIPHMMEEIKKLLVPPKEWAECLKCFDGKDEVCTLCGFSPDKLIKSLTENK